MRNGYRQKLVQSKARARLGKPRSSVTALAVAACFGAGLAGSAQANPVGPTVTNGAAQFTTTGNLLTVTNSPNTIINWGSFSIGANEITRFAQQSASSLVLNRVLGQNPSAILGALQSNGRVMLINPNGIVFGAGSQINVAGLTASTLNITDADFLAGRFRFADGLGNAVINNGSITAGGGGGGGNVYLVGNAVTNNGIITSPNGEVVLAAGNSVELVNPGTPDLRVQISAPDNLAVNLGSIVADSGRVGIYAGLISHGGSINADSVTVGENGQITLQATRNTTLAAGSSLSANGPSGGTVTVQSGDTTLAAGTIEAKGSAGQGGAVKVLGNLVGLTNAAVDASGASGGGTVLIGGDLHGTNPDVQNAYRSYVGQDVTIKADATTAGDGGKVVVWADDITRYYGSISAKGGAQSGNGGQVETSGHNTLDFNGRVDTSAANGNVGTLLLDPSQITIMALPDSQINGLPAGPTFTGKGGLSNLSVSTLEGALANNDVLVDATAPAGGGPAASIAVNDPVSWTSNHGLALSAGAAGVIAVNASISTTGTGNITFIGDTTVAPGSLGTVSTGGAIHFSGNGLTWSSGTIAAGAGMDSAGGMAVLVNGPVTLGGTGWTMGDAVTATPNASINGGGAQVTLNSGATWTVTNGTLTLQASSGNTPLVGQGTLSIAADGAMVLAADQVATIGNSSMQFDNFGTVTVTTSTSSATPTKLTIAAQNGNSGTHQDTGTYAIGTGPAGGSASLVFSPNGFRALTGTGKINGAGPGSLTIQGGQVNFETGATYDDTNLTGGTLFSGGAVVINVPMTFSQGLSNTGSTVSGSGDLTVSGGTFNWSNASLTSVFNGTGKLIVNVPANLGTGQLTLLRELDANKGFTMSGGAGIEIDNNAGFGWTGKLVSGDGTAASASTLNSTFGLPVTGDGTFVVMPNNTLTITPPGVSNLATLSVGTFNNNGQVDLTSGTLHISGSGPSGGTITDAGLYVLPNNGTLQFSNASRVLSGGTAAGGTGAGITMLVDSGSLTANAGVELVTENLTVNGTGAVSLNDPAVNVQPPQAKQITIADTGTLTVKGSTLTVPTLKIQDTGTLTGTANVSVTDTLTWGGGTITGAGGTATLSTSKNPAVLSGSLFLGRGWNVNSGLSSTGTGTTLDIDDQTLTNTGGTFSNSGTITVTSGPNGKWQNDGVINNTAGTLNLNVAQFKNSLLGHITVSGGSITTGASTQLRNDGVVAVNNGSLTINAGNDMVGNDGGTYHAPGAGASIVFTGGTRTFGNLSAVGDPGDQGTVFFNGGTVTFASGSSVGGSGNVAFGGGTADVLAGATYNTTGGTFVQGGTLRFGTDGSTGTLGVSSGSLSGTVAGTTLNVTTNTANAVHWTAGAIDNTNLALNVVGEMNIALTGQSATLINANNDFQNTVEVTAVSAQITDKNALELGTRNVTNNLVVSAGTGLDVDAASGTVGGTLTLGTASGNINILGNVTSGGAQTYNGAVMMGTGATLATTNSDVSFNGTVTLRPTAGLTVANGSGNTSFKDVIDGANSLTVTGTGATAFSKGVGGGTALTGLTVGGLVNVNGGSVKTSGNQIYGGGVSVDNTAAVLTTTGGGAVTIGGAGALKQDLTINSGTGNVTFNGALDGPNALTVNSSGTTAFKGQMGVTTRLASLTTGTGGTSSFSGGAAVHTIGDIALDNPVTGGGFTLDSQSGAVAATSAGNNFTGNFTVDANTAALSTPGALDLTLNGSGATALSAGTNLTVAGAFGNISAAGAGAGGSISLHSTAPMLTVQAAATNGGSIDLGADHGNLVISGNVATGTGGMLATSATGTQTLQGGSIVVGDYTIGSGGSGLTLASGKLIVNHTLTNAGALDLGGQTVSAATFDNKGTLKGNGTIGTATLPTVLTNTGTISPGNSPGTLNVVGDFATTGTLNMELGPSQFDRIVVSGNTMLGGTLNVQQFNGFTPAPGAGFQIITTQGTSNGTFSAVNVAPAFAGMLVTYDSKFTDVVLPFSISVSSPSSSSSSSSSQDDAILGSLTAAMDLSDEKKKQLAAAIARLENEAKSSTASSCQ